jgi:hypothetical protein
MVAAIGRLMAIGLVAGLVAGLAVGCDRPGIVGLPPPPASTPGLLIGCTTDSNALDYPTPGLLDLSAAVGLDPLAVTVYRTKWGDECPRLDAAPVVALPADCGYGFPWLGSQIPPIGSVQLELTIDAAVGRIREIVLAFGQLGAVELLVRSGAAACGGVRVEQHRDYTVYRMPDTGTGAGEELVANSPLVTFYLAVPPGLSAVDRANLLAGAMLQADHLHDQDIVDRLLADR